VAEIGALRTVIAPEDRDDLRDRLTRCERDIAELRERG
jgi:hypothetical protein